MAAVCGDVEGLRFNTGVAKSSPFQVIPGELGIGHGLGLVSYGVNGRGAIDRFLRSGDIGEPCGFAYDKPGRRKGKRSGNTHCCFTQFMTGATRTKREDGECCQWSLDSFSFVLLRHNAGDGCRLAAVSNVSISSTSEQTSSLRCLDQPKPPDAGLVWPAAVVGW